MAPVADQVGATRRQDVKQEPSRGYRRVNRLAEDNEIHAETPQARRRGHRVSRAASEMVELGDERTSLDSRRWMPARLSQRGIERPVSRQNTAIRGNSQILRRKSARL
jgi:hypothetical protein